MSFSTTTNIAGPYAMNGVQTIFPWAFPILDASHLKVIVTDVNGNETALTTGYTASGIGVMTGGSVTVTDPKATGFTLTIKRVLPLDQPTSIRNMGAFYPEIHEQVFDRLTMIDQQQEDELRRAIQLDSPTGNAPVKAIPGYAVGFDAEGKPAAVPNTGVDQFADLANTTDPAKGAGRIGYGAVSYPVGTVGYQIANRVGRAELAELFDPTTGAAMVGFNPSLAYNSNTVGSRLNDLASATTGKGASLVGYLAPYTGAVARTQQGKNADYASVKDFGATGDSVTDDTTAIQAAIDSGAGVVYFPPGVYLISSSLSVLGRFVTLRGAGMLATTIRANAVIAEIINAWETTDANPSPLVIQDMTLDGSANKATNGLYLRYRHGCLFQNVYFAYSNYNLQAKDSWNNVFINCTFNAAYATNVWLVGSNHRNKFTGCTLENGTTLQLLIQKAGTAMDGNKAISFDNCDLEYSTAGGCVDIDADSVDFIDCYLGEGHNTSVLTIRNNSLVTVSGGYFYFGAAAVAYGVNALGGETYFRNALIEGATYSTLDVLIHGAGGKVKINDCAVRLANANAANLLLDPLQYHGTNNFAENWGRNYGVESAGATPPTFTNTFAANHRTITCTVIGSGGTPMMGLQGNLQNASRWLAETNGMLAVVYSSNKPVVFNLSAPTTTVATLPSTGGAQQTWVLPQYLFPNVPSTNYTLAEFQILNPAVNDTLTLYEIVILDARGVPAATGATISGLFKS